MSTKICQTILDRFDMNQRNFVCILVLSETKLSKQDKKDNVDPNQFNKTVRCEV